MAKLTLTDVTNILGNETSAANTINSNSTAIETAIENTLSRDGTSPNQMGASLDMNSNRVLNLPEPSSDHEPARKIDVTNAIGTVLFDVPGATSGYTHVAAEDVASGTVTLPATTDTLVGKATTDTLTNKTIDTSGPNTIKIKGNTLDATAGTATVTVPNSTDTLVGRATTDTLTNKTIDTASNTLKLNGNTVAASAGTATISVPNSTDTLVGRATTDTLTNKTINGASNTLTVRLGSDVTGNLDVTHLNGGTGANGTTFWRGDGTWATPAGGSSAEIIPPPGRLTLTTGVAVTTADVTGATTIYYTPATGNQVCLYDGTSMVVTTFTELSLALDSLNTDTGYHQSGKNFDLFVVNDGGTIRLVTGPAWTSDTARGTGAGTTELQLLNGLWTNKNSMTARFGSATANTTTVAANKGTYVGSFRAVANGQAEDSMAKRLVYNAYNQAKRQLLRNDATPSWNYSTATYRQANGSTANQVSYVAGLAGSSLDAQALSIVVNSTSTWNVVFSGIGIDSTTVNGATVQEFSRCDASTVPGVPKSYYTGFAQLGKHDVVWLEKGSGSGDTQTWIGTEATGKYKSGIWGSVWA